MLRRDEVDVVATTTLQLKHHLGKALRRGLLTAELP
jgi:hypothetical protein